LEHKQQFHFGVLMYRLIKFQIYRDHIKTGSNRSDQEPDII